MAEANTFRGLYDLRGSTAIVTGAAGILGKTFCAALAEHGANVAAIDVNAADVEKLAADLSSKYPSVTKAFTADVSDPASIKAVVETIENDVGPVNILLNNAATKGPNLDRFFDRVEDFDVDTWRAIMAVNLDGVFLMAREIGTRMVARGAGSIVQIASIYGVIAPDQRIYEGSRYLDREINSPAVYSASKAGVIGLTRHLAAYWQGTGVRVNALTPGGVFSGQNSVFEQRYSAKVPLGRMAQPQEIAAAAVFLSSNASSYVSGHNLVVDGGLSIW